MALNGSGAISLAGTTVGQSIACELGCSGTGQIDINRADVRTLAAVPSGQISFSSFYGKSSGPSTRGQVWCGGYYIGVINAGVGSYYVSIAPNASGCTQCIWKTTRTATGGATSLVNGYSNTWGPLNNASHPAGNWCATRSINGFADWYLPAKDELNTMYQNKASMPAGEGYAASFYWNSVESTATSACTQLFTTGAPSTYTKTCTFSCVRAVRRTPV